MSQRAAAGAGERADHRRLPDQPRLDGRRPGGTRAVQRLDRGDGRLPGRHRAHAAGPAGVPAAADRPALAEPAVGRRGPRRRGGRVRPAGGGRPGRRAGGRVRRDDRRHAGGPRGPADDRRRGARRRRSRRRCRPRCAPPTRRSTARRAWAPAARPRAPGADREPFDPERATRQARRTRPLSFGGSICGGLLAPLRTLSFWKMKDRARQFGEAAAHRLLGDLRYAAGGRGVRFHLMGHSFGCIVASAMRGRAGGGRRLPRPVDSLVLVQGALSLWSYCSDIPAAPGPAGYFRRIVDGAPCPRADRHDAVGVRHGRRPLVSAGPPASAGQVAFAPSELPRYGAVGHVRRPRARGWT